MEEKEPMKCIKNKETEVITKTYDENAFRMIKAGTHVFVPRKEWKMKVRDAGKNSS